MQRVTLHLVTTPSRSLVFLLFPCSSVLYIIYQEYIIQYSEKMHHGKEYSSTLYTSMNIKKAHGKY